MKQNVKKLEEISSLLGYSSIKIFVFTQIIDVKINLLGNGRRRSISCPSCNGQAEGNKLLAPLALACGADGSIFVGDFNYIRRIFPSGNVTSVMELR